MTQSSGKMPEVPDGRTCGYVEPVVRRDASVATIVDFVTSRHTQTTAMVAAGPGLSVAKLSRVKLPDKADS